MHSLHRGFLVNKDDIVCQSCWNRAKIVSVNGSRPDESPLGHRRVCTLCGRSLLRRIRCHQLKTGSDQDCQIIEVVKEWILPRLVGVFCILCHSCWLRATKAIRHLHLGLSKSAASPNAISEPYSHESVISATPEDQRTSEQDSQLLQESRPAPLQESKPANLHEYQPVLLQDFQPTPKQESNLATLHNCQTTPKQEQTATTVPNARANTIDLPDYFRPIETERRCFVDSCKRSQRIRLTLLMRKQLLRRYNYYVPPNNRLCDFHMKCTSWDFLSKITVKNTINSFTAKQIQDMMWLNISDVNFDDESMKDRISNGVMFQFVSVTNVGKDKDLH
ncbi:uncharacterized protein LOC112054116 [Bicyclus anynana]|uniref:Uncharacterized protein LOC112054116 n=1 Tax=Bicyclus anynana TaxID=110368 RepID=A0ABM3M0C5_BICAN|nr:uncharacterized protein LOC112054116 [Bicyclus anynana]